jgi:hypothetical protein
VLRAGEQAITPVRMYLSEAGGREEGLARSRGRIDDKVSSLFEFVSAPIRCWRRCHNGPPQAPLLSCSPKTKSHNQSSLARPDFRTTVATSFTLTLSTKGLYLDS